MSADMDDLRAIAPDPERMLAVRQRVLAEIAAEARPNWPLRLAWAFGLALVATALLSSWPHAQRLDLSAVKWPTVNIRPPEFAYELTPKLEPPAPREAPKAIQFEIVESTADGVQLRLPSSDPDVIVYYFLENPGE